MAKAKKSNSVPKHLIITGSILLLLAIFFVVLIIQDSGKPKETIKVDKSNGEDIVLTEDEVLSDVKDEVEYIEVVDNLDSAATPVVGASLITSDGKVVNEKGQVVQNNAAPMTSLAPRLSEPMSEGELAPGTIKIEVDESGFKPNVINVKAGEVITIAISAKNVSARLVFEDSSLSALELPVKAGYTVAKTFSAPSAGEYIFFQDMPGKYEQTGKMIVK